MIKTLTALVLAGALSACTAFNTQTKQVQAACASATAVINVLADHAGSLSDGQKTATLEAISVITPVCGQGAAPTYDTVTLAAVNAALAKLTTIKGELQ